MGEKGERAYLTYIRGEILILAILLSRGLPVSPRATEMTGRLGMSVMVRPSTPQVPGVRASQEQRPGQDQGRHTESGPTHQEKEERAAS